MWSKESRSWIGIAVALLWLGWSGAAMAQPAVDLVFCIDGSGSMDDAEFAIQVNGTADAVEDPTVVPQDGSVRLSVVQFATTVSSTPPQGMQPVVIDDTNATMVADDIRHLQQSGLGTNTNIADCIFEALALLQAASPHSDRWVIDISTDGNPTAGGDPIAAAQAAIAAGVDQINVIGIGDNVDEDFLHHLAQPQNGDEGDGFVITIDDIADYPAAIQAKIERELGQCASVTDLEVLCATDESGTFTLTFTFTNQSDHEVVHVWLDDAWLVDSNGDPLPDPVSLEPHYFSFVGDPICTTMDPLCTDPSRTLTVTVEGAAPGDTLQFLLSIHNATYELCCDELVTVELPSCDCAQIVDEQVRCRWSWPPFQLHRLYTFTLQNLFSETVTKIRLTPIAPPYPQIVFDPDVINGLSLSPPPYSAGEGETTQTVEVTGPAATGGQMVTFLISTHNDHGLCCAIERTITLPKCWIVPYPYPYPYDTKLIKIGHDEGGFVVSGFGAGTGTGTGVSFGVGAADGAIAVWEDPRAAVSSSAGAYLQLEARGALGGGAVTLGTLRVEDLGGQLSVAADSALGAVRGIELYREGVLVAELSVAGSSAVTVSDTAWPTGAAFDRARGGLAALWPQAVAVSVGMTSTAIYADQVVWSVEATTSPESITDLVLTAGDIEALQVGATAAPIEP